MSFMARALFHMLQSVKLRQRRLGWAVTSLDRQRVPVAFQVLNGLRHRVRSVSVHSPLLFATAKWCFCCKDYFPRISVISQLVRRHLHEFFCQFNFGNCKSEKDGVAVLLSARASDDASQYRSKDLLLEIMGWSSGPQCYCKVKSKSRDRLLFDLLAPATMSEMSFCNWSFKYIMWAISSTVSQSAGLSAGLTWIP